MNIGFLLFLLPTLQSLSSEKEFDGGLLLGPQGKKRDNLLLDVRHGLVGLGFYVERGRGRFRRGRGGGQEPHVEAHVRNDGLFDIGLVYLGRSLWQN